MFSRFTALWTGSSQRNGGKCKVYVASDLHVHHHSNLEHIQQWPRAEGDPAILIVAGDIATKMEEIRGTLLHLQSLYHHVIYVPGNNELRIYRKDPYVDSLEKLNAILEMCQEIGVHCTRDGLFECALSSAEHSYRKLVIAPLLSWYHPAFAKQPREMSPQEIEQLGTDYQRGWLDFRTVKWPAPYDYLSIESKMLELSREQLSLSQYEPADDIFLITTSHFMPRRELVPRLATWVRPTISYVLGSPKLEDCIRDMHSQLHVSGHSHMDHDTTLQGIRYLQHAYGHPGERKQWWKSDAPYFPKLAVSL